jgi:zinc protease
VHPLRHYGYFTVNAAVRNDVVAASLTEIFYEIDRMRSLPVAEDELADAQTYMSGVFSLGLATQDGLASQLSSVYLYDLPEDYLETFRQRVRAVTEADVLSATRAYFDSANAQIIVVGDRSQIADQVRLFGSVTEYDAEPK